MGELFLRSETITNICSSTQVIVLWTGTLPVPNIVYDGHARQTLRTSHTRIRQVICAFLPPFFVVIPYAFFMIFPSVLVVRFQKFKYSSSRRIVSELENRLLGEKQGCSIQIKKVVIRRKRESSHGNKQVYHSIKNRIVQSKLRRSLLSEK